LRRQDDNENAGRTVSLFTFICIVIALFVGFLLGRSRANSYQNRGEALLSRTLRAHFRAPGYHLLNHVTLPMKDGSTQVDHILVSRFGVFVIETKDYKGWIFADPKQAQWTQVLFKSKFRFQNPLFQNQRHLRAVQALLDVLPPEAIHSVVVFTGEATFKTDMPPGVFTLSDLVAHLRGHTTEVMSLNRLQFCVGRLETARFAISGKTDVEHVESLERRRGGG
jgi:Nuclease-related domain